MAQLEAESVATSDSIEMPKDSPFPLSAKDREVLAMNDSDFQPMTWPQLRHLISTHQLEQLKRRPSQLRLYTSWCRDITASFGSVANFVLLERLGWTPLPSPDPDAAPRFEYASAVPFRDRRDFKVLVNDWPYGVEEGIAHLVVWIRSPPIPADGETGVLTDEGRALIGEFVETFFVTSCRRAGLLGEHEDGEERVLWFKNWTKLQSVRAVEHVHVLVRGATEELLRGWCG